MYHTSTWMAFKLKSGRASKIQAKTKKFLWSCSVFCGLPHKEQNIKRDDVVNEVKQSMSQTFAHGDGCCARNCTDGDIGCGGWWLPLDNVSSPH